MLQEFKRLREIHDAAKAHIKQHQLAMCLGELTPSQEIEYTNALQTKRAAKKEIFKLIDKL